MLFDLRGFAVVQCREDAAGSRTLVIISEQTEHACTGCGLIQPGRADDYRLSRLKDLPFGTRSLVVWWRKRRFRCTGCPRVFTEVHEQVGPRRRLTVRLRRQLERSVSASVRSCADVAREYGVWDWSAHQALAERARELAAAGPVLAPVTRLGLDEMRTRRFAGSATGAVGGAARTRG